MNRKWQTVRSETLLKDRWINLRADHCLTSTGIEISPYCGMFYPDWDHVAGLTESSCLVLIRQYCHAPGEFYLDLPGGAVDPDDPGLEYAAPREVAEETNLPCGARR